MILFIKTRYLDNKADNSLIKFGKHDAVVSGHDAHDRRQTNALVGLFGCIARMKRVAKRLFVLMTGIRDFDNVIASALQDQKADPGAQIVILCQLVDGILYQVANDGVRLIGAPVSLV
ncbi:MAG: hypothetical protein LUF30_07215 [Lachnospiraceae bacterium]|nr:hypothetical protein [Lachnospiraceae bacterium]